MDRRARAVKPTVGEELSCQRRTLGVGLETLADRTGLDAAMIKRIEGGAMRPRDVMLAALALALGTTQAGRRQWLMADTCFARLIRALREGDVRGPGSAALPLGDSSGRIRMVKPCLACGRVSDTDLTWEAGGYDDYPLLSPLCGRRGCPPTKVRADIFRGLFGDADHSGPDGVLTSSIWLAVTEAQEVRAVASPTEVTQAHEAVTSAQREAGRWAAERMGRLLRPDD
jgi:transcriptional regulator with XRE-family HTH domain